MQQGKMHVMWWIMNGTNEINEEQAHKQFICLQALFEIVKRHNILCY